MADPRTGNIERATAEAEHIGPAFTGDNISAKKVANYMWDGSNWVRMTQSQTVTERYDYNDSTTIYTATAPIGTTDASLGWTITKYDLTDSNDASGKVATDVSWDDRATGSFN